MSTLDVAMFVTGGSGCFFFFMRYWRWRFSTKVTLERERLVIQKNEQVHQHFLAENQALNPPPSPPQPDPEVAIIEAKAEAEVKLLKVKSQLAQTENQGGRGNFSGMVMRDCTVCGVRFAIPIEYQNRRKNDHRGFKCPNDHIQVI